MGKLDIETRLDRVESRFAIAELCQAYCTTCDARDMDGMAAIFTEDVEFESPDGGMNAKGKEDVIAMFNRVFSIRGPGYHWTHDHSVTFDENDPNLATGLVLAHAETSPEKKFSIAAFRYNDIYRREGGVWLFARRSLTFFYYAPVEDLLGRFQKLDRVKTPEGWRTADFPESLSSWKEWLANN